MNIEHSAFNISKVNFLAHLLLSGPAAAPDYPHLLLGKFVADAVPGRQLEAYPAAVQAGIRLHRALDTFTDAHPVVRRSTARLRLAGLGKYAGVVSDVFLDHFLARHFEEFSAEPLAAFAPRVYQQLTALEPLMPPRFQHLLPYLTRQDWLSGYAHFEGIGRTLAGLARRAQPGSGMAGAEAELQAHHAAYEADFMDFFPQAQAHSQAVLAQFNA